MFENEAGHYLSLSMRYIIIMKRKDRYQGMFKLLSSSIRTSSKRVRFKNAIEWSLKSLKKDDRIVWYLSILQRFALLELRGQEMSKTKKLRNKIERKIQGWEEDRIREDFELFTEEKWEHFANVQAVFSHPMMLDYSFYEKVSEKLVAKKASEVFDDFEKMENHLQSQPGNDRFCSDGEVQIEFGDGWAWFGVAAGFSRQEATAMRHCGNGEGGNGDYLFSLREPIKKISNIHWKPHLTFILNGGYLGEMKGYGNQKPDSRFHSYIESLLLSPVVQGIKGGGFLPEKNFNFLELEESMQTRILEKKPDFEFEPIGNCGEVLLEVSDLGAWHIFDDGEFPDEAKSRVFDWPSKNTKWLVFQSTLSTSIRDYQRSHAWCFLEQGRLSRLYIEGYSLCVESVVPLLKSKFVSSLNEDLLSLESQLAKVLKKEQIDDLLVNKPSFFTVSPLEVLFERVGHSKAMVENINYRFGLEVKMHSEGLELQSYSSLIEFAEQTGVGSMPRKIQNLGNPQNWPTSEIDLFQIPWLTLHYDENRDLPFYLFLNQNEIMQFFDTMNLAQNEEKICLLREIIYRFGSPELTFTNAYSEAA